jgi:NADPH:quinone reductase-like Zn-dependent oxidoreductase
MGADVVIDYKTQEFEDVLRDYDVVLNSQNGKTLQKSLRVLKRGGTLLSITDRLIPNLARKSEHPGS